MTHSDIDKIRSIPLPQLLESFGLQAKREGTSLKFSSQSHAINVTGQQWYDHKQGAGGGGAIDLVMYLRDCSFLEACSALGGVALLLPIPKAFPSSAIPCAKRQKSFSEQMEEYARPDFRGWQLARRYLTDQRALPIGTLIPLHRKGDIFATRRGSIAFLHRTLSGAVAGCTLRGFSPGSQFKLNLGNKKHAWFMLGDFTQSKRAVLVESPIEALSYDALHPGHQDAIISVSGMYVSKQLLESLFNCGLEVKVGFNTDTAGQEGYARVCRDWNLLNASSGQQRPEPENDFPVGAKDWNEVLVFLRNKIRPDQSARNLSLHD